MWRGGRRVPPRYHLAATTAHSLTNLPPLRCGGGRRRNANPTPNPHQVWRRQEKECFLTLRGHADWVTRAVFDSDGLMVVSCSYDKHAKLWRLSDGEEQLTFYGHDSWIADVAFSPEGRSIATASGDFTVRIWQARGAPPMHTHTHTPCGSGRHMHTAQAVLS